VIKDQMQPKYDISDYLKHSNGANPRCNDVYFTSVLPF